MLGEGGTSVLSCVLDSAIIPLIAEKSNPACLGSSFSPLGGGEPDAGDAVAGVVGAGDAGAGDADMRGGRSSSSSGIVDEDVRGFLVQEMEVAEGGRETF